MKTILFCPRGNPGGPPETEPNYILYQYADLPRAIEFLAVGQPSRPIAASETIYPGGGDRP